MILNKLGGRTMEGKKILLILLILGMFLVSSCRFGEMGKPSMGVDVVKGNVEKSQIVKEVPIIERNIEILKNYSLYDEKNPDRNTLYIDYKVIDALENSSKVRVIIRGYNLSEVDRILENLGEEDFELKGRMVSRPTINGYITKSGLDKLKKNEWVSSIFADEKIVRIN